ncbi:MAG: hypothetical protein EOQ86_00955 [Mesorhizobium sp.]|uniref:hypothetical protein n=1 Tax=Mesorhizobium sp. TaxID=1871066 RepID=UPI000FE81CDF|nr:hypothetical protein [Mesorhizobium sp.]RWH84358.1 MAG: hypothetical protein EOQ85_01935 [Mesorhizobium sp.]RWH86744.1 MAG: hypothetical protein EOQ86_00955 [Mesorhizobium sp.]RWH93718.1 MAG: hypothetical protein EOQ87_04175 [Mesorhizobium sp.]RWI02825.1 MAG: hypothetical protein EOQ88_00955 [Mesorhizobium sp.]RWI05335.1 MAG: hypothetical protein EOQ89_05000 [Mesorhizobium sp.]
MSIEAILAAIPAMEAKKRATIRANAEAKLSHPSSGGDARRVVDALDARSNLRQMSSPSMSLVCRSRGA